MSSIKLEDVSTKEQAEMPYSALCALRRDAYTRRVGGMNIDPALRAWAERMTQLHGPLVRVWHNELPWLEALMVVRYGEEPATWPPQFSEKDIQRVADWESGRAVPAGVTHLGRVIERLVKGKE